MDGLYFDHALAVSRQPCMELGMRAVGGPRKSQLADLYVERMQQACMKMSVCFRLHFLGLVLQRYVAAIKQDGGLRLVLYCVYMYGS